MSAQEMCSVPTPDGDVEVPVGTVILWGEALRFADKGGYQWDSDEVGDGEPLPYGNHAATIIAVPDGEGGWTVPGATEPEWVALTEDQVALLPDRTPVRVEWDGVVTEGPLHRDRTRTGGVNLHHAGGIWWVGNTPRVTVYVHPEDVPDDPDADLIERAAKAAFDAAEEVASNAPTGRPRHAEWDDADSLSKDVHRAAARAALAVFRGEQA